MSYRTYIYYGDEEANGLEKDLKHFQILGNNESYDEWFDEMVKQGIITKEELEEYDFCYGLSWVDTDSGESENKLTCEVKDIMGFIKALEKVIMDMEDFRIKERKENPSEDNKLSYFDFSSKYETVKSTNGRITLTDELFNIFNYSYIMMPLVILKQCEECLERVPFNESTDKDRFYNFRIKKGKKIYIAAY